MIVGHLLGRVMTEVQPMKMAAAEALYETERPAPVCRCSRSATLDEVAGGST